MFSLIADSFAITSEVAKQANVGISALYRRYAGKEVLLQTLCANGLHRFITIAEQALATEAGEANKLSGRLFRRAKAAGVLRADLHLNDVAMLLEQVTAIRLGDAERTQTLRHRYLALQLDALRPEAATSKLPAPPPTSAELGRRWIPTSKVSGR